MSTRERILALLCSGERTAAELAEALGISRSAVRNHLEGLQGASLVEHERVIRGVGKPAHRYRLTPVGEGLLSRAYLPLTASLLRVLPAYLEAGQLEEFLREAGRQLAPSPSRTEGDQSTRIAAAVELIEKLGGIVEVEPLPEGATLRGLCCPVAALALEHPQVCAALEEMLAAHTGLTVREQCIRSGRPSCRFEVRTGEA